MNKTFCIFVLFISTHLNGQIIRDDKIYTGIGLTGGSMNQSQNITGGLSIFIGINLLQTYNSSFSICTNLKIGTEDRTGFAVYAAAPIEIVDGIAGRDVLKFGPNVNTFFEAPILFHYNFGFGSSRNANDRLNFGFYLGGGFNYILTGYNDTTGNSIQVSFFAYTTDIGIRFRGGLDINLSASFSTKQPIEQISRPKLFELTISKYFRHY